ncbi:13359_t:CDS:2, partial [Acaulospora colombiana]
MKSLENVTGEGMSFSEALDSLDLFPRVEQDKDASKTRETSFFGQSTLNLKEGTNYALRIPELSSRPVDVLLESLPELQTAARLQKQDACSSNENNQTSDSLSMKSSQDPISETPPSIWEAVLNYKEHGQMISWESIGKSKPSMNKASPYLTEADISTYEAVWHNHFHHEFSYGNTGVAVAQELLVQNILNLIIGIPSNLFSYDPIKRIFSPKIPNIRIRGCSARSTNMMMSRFLNLGTHIKRLENTAERCMKAASLYGLTGVAFGRSLASFILLIRKSLVAMSEKNNATDHTIIVGLYHVIDEVSLIDVSNTGSAELSAEQSAQLKKEGFYLPFGSGILSEIYSTAESVDSTRSPFLKCTLLAFLKHSSEPFFQMLSSWLGVSASSAHAPLPIDAPKGDFHDPYKEFFIVNFEIDASFVKHDGNCFWQDGIQVSDKNPLPIFIDTGLARDVLEAGKSLRLLRDCRPNHPLCQASTMLDPLTSKPIWSTNMKWLFIQGDID